MDLDWHLLRISEEDATSSQPPPPPNPIADARPRKKKARTLCETDWEPYKDRIIQLHHVEKRPLPEVRILIEQEFGFTAEIRQYRSRLSQWKLDKNIKPDEMKAIVRHHQQRNLVETDKDDLKFRVRGQEVEPHKIERWMKRHDVMDSMLYAPSPDATTPSAVSYATMSEIGSPGINSMLPPGTTHDVDFTVENTPTTPPQSIGSSPTTPRQRTDDAFEAPPWYITDRWYGLHLVQVDDEHSFTWWRHRFDPTDLGTTMKNGWSPLIDAPWLQDVRSERTYGLVPEREVIVLCRYLISAYLCVRLSPTAPRSFGRSESIDLIIYICHDPHTQTLGARFTALGTQAKDLHDSSMGFDIVTSGGVRTCKFAHKESWMNTDEFVSHMLLEWGLVIAGESGLQPFTWPSDDNRETARFFTRHFSAQHAHE